MKKFHKPGSVVSVKWRDAAAMSSGGYWEDKADALTFSPAVVHTVGFVVRHTEKKITLMQSFDKNGHVGGVFSIPADWIQEIVQL
jgi:hypothetical protein